MMAQVNTAPKLRHQPPTSRFWESVAILHRRRTTVIALFSAVAIVAHLVLRFAFHASPGIYRIPLWATFFFGGIPLVYELARNLLRREFGSDLLAGISIVTSVFLNEYLAGAIVVLMLSGGEALENYALRNASSVLRALAKRMPAIAHRKRDSVVSDVALDDIAVGDILVIYPHDISPVDGTVIEGNGVMNEAFLTGEPFEITKAPGSAVISGAVNGEAALTITATRRAVDSRYAKIMEVMRESEQNQPHLRRLGDQLGAIYTPVAVSIAVLAWLISGEAVRFLAVLVIATPCPLLIAIPVAIIGSISLAARRSIVVKFASTISRMSSPTNRNAAATRSSPGRRRTRPTSCGAISGSGSRSACRCSGSSCSPGPSRRWASATRSRDASSRKANGISRRPRDIATTSTWWTASTSSRWPTSRARRCRTWWPRPTLTSPTRAR